MASVSVLDFSGNISLGGSSRGGSIRGKQNKDDITTESQWSLDSQPRHVHLLNELEDSDVGGVSTVLR